MANSLFYIPAQLINYFGIDCRKVHPVAEDEWADESGNIAPITYEAGFAHSMIKYLYYQIDEKLRMSMENVHFPTNANIKDYSKIINDITEGTGADISSTSPGWAGHMAFVTPYLPSSILQTKKTQVYISEELAAPFEC